MGSTEPVGMVAGWGRYPMVVAERLRERGIPLIVAGIKDHADPELANWSDDFGWFGVAKLGGHIRWFRKHGVKQVTLAGKLFKDKLLFGTRSVYSHFPDWCCVRTLYPHFVTRTRDARDDSLLGAVCDAYRKQGMTIVPGTDIAPELLAEVGQISYRAPSFSQQRDIEFGWKIAKQMGGLDIGQSITVKDQTVLAVEAVEGTDALIARTAQICPHGGFTLVKVAKPQQDLRFDLPTVGVRTLELLHRAGGKCLAIEAGKTILIDRELVVQYAKKSGISIVAMQEDDAALGLSTVRRSAA